MGDKYSHLQLVRHQWCEGLDLLISEITGRFLQPGMKISVVLELILPNAVFSTDFDEPSSRDLELNAIWLKPVKNRLKYVEKVIIG
jgi:hypothetical protein